MESQSILIFLLGSLFGGGVVYWFWRKEKQELQGRVGFLQTAVEQFLANKSTNPIHNRLLLDTLVKSAIRVCDFYYTQNTPDRNF